MASLATIQAQLPALLSDLLGDLPVSWRRSARSMADRARAQIDPIAMGMSGIDERIWIACDAEGEDASLELATHVRQRVRGMRAMTIQVSVWTPATAIGNSARVYLERLRSRLYLESTYTALRALGLGLVNVFPIVHSDFREDDRSVSQASIDLAFSYGHTELGAPILYFDRARVITEIASADGAVNPDLQLEINARE